MANAHKPRLHFGARPDVRADVSSEAFRRWNPSLQAANADAATIPIMQPIGQDMWGEGVTARRVETALSAIGDRPVNVPINSPGGDVFEGAAIYELLRAHARDKGEVTVQIMGLAASAASIIAMAGDNILIGQSSFLMIHNSWVIAIGDRNALREVSDWLEPFDAAMAGVYEAQTGMATAEIVSMMNDETWFNAKRAIELGFADGLLEADAITTGSDADPEARTTRAEKQFDLLAAKAGVSRNDAKALLSSLKGGMPGAAATGQPEAADLEAGMASIIASLKGS